MLAPTIPDVEEPATVETMDRSELIAYIHKLEGQRSAWELRIRTCEEKEQLWKNLMQQLSIVLAATFQKCHESINQRAEEAAKIAEEMRIIAHNVEDM